jgi:autotransporter strand-loop-strand O-heptosyltransferase
VAEQTVEQPNFKIKKQLTKPGEEDKVFFNFVNGGPRVEIHGTSNKKYTMTFVDDETDTKHVTYENVPAGEWRDCDIEYYVKWRIEVKEIGTDKQLRNYTLDLAGKRVLITYESSALGDTLAWMPYVEEFRKKHNCIVICSSFHNDMFEKIYPEIEFVKRGQPVTGCHVAYKLGWFGSGHANSRNPNTCHIIPLQKVASDILGIEYEGEIRTTLNKDPRPKMFKNGKYVVITTCSTAQFKYWNKPEGWQELVNWLVRKGYGVINIGKMPNFLKNVYNFTGKRKMEDLFNIIQNCDFFIGLPSGLAWLSWALGKKSVMITGISEAFCEFRQDNYRAENTSVCHGCFNDPTHTFDKGDWMYCPLHKGTAKHFECTKEISVQDVQKIVVQVERDLKAKKLHWSMTDDECDEYLDTLELIR